MDKTLAVLRQNGVEPAFIQRLINTHGHSDHIGGNGAIQRLSGCTISASPLTAYWLNTHDRHNLWLDHFGQVIEFTAVDTIIEPDTVVSLGGIDFEVLSLPGHGPGTIGFYQPDSRVMICADALWEHDVAMLNVVIHGETVLDDAQSTLDKLRGHDIRVAIPGHGGLITDMEANLDSAARRLASFRKDPNKLAWHLARRILMFTLLRYQPIEQGDLWAIVAQSPWIHDYAPLCGREWTPESLFATVMAGFLDKGTVMVTEDKLTSTVPK